MTRKGMHNSSILVVAKNILNTGGYKSFFKGGAARSTWWFFVCSIFFPIYETSKSFGLDMYTEKQDAGNSCTSEI